jgi:hypothetical protein
MAINFLDGITIDGLSTQGSEATALVMDLMLLEPEN